MEPHLLAPRRSGMSESTGPSAESNGPKSSARVRATRPVVLTGAAAVIALLITTAWALGGRTASPPTAAAAEVGASPGITVSAVGTVSGAPDALRLMMSLTTTGDTVSVALEQANTVTAKVFAALKAQGVKDEDLQTADLSIQQDTDNNGTITGYRVTESMTAVLRDLATAGAVITQATQAGGDAVRVDGVSLDMSDSSKLMTSARERAFAEAKKKAEQYASAASRPLGAVQSISESVSTTPIAAGIEARPAAGSAVPIQAGTQQVSVTVTVTFAFG